MRLSERQLRGLIRELLIVEGKCDKASGHAGCIRKRDKGWVVLSNKTGECWGRSKKKGGECTYYDTKADAEAALGAYHR
jgi:hypothetical protein